MTKTIIFIFTCLFITNNLFAQKIEEGYDINFKPATSAGWRYYVITEKKDSMWYREAFYIPEKGMAMMGSYKDKECKKAEGKITWFHPNKTLKSEINYKNGKQDGIALQYHENGMMSDSSNYTNGHRTGISLGWDKDGNQVDSTNFDGKGNGTVVKWYETGTVYYTGRMTNDTTRVSRWTYYHNNGKLLATEDYVTGQVVRCSCLDEAGRQLDSLVCIGKEADFSNDPKGWTNFLSRNLDPNIPIKNRAPEGTYMVMVQFVVDKDGRISDIKPLTKFGFGMEEEVIRILRKSPKWIPAIQFGRNVKAYRRQPVTFVVARS